MFVIQGTYFSHFVWYINSSQIAYPEDILSSQKIYHYVLVYVTSYDLVSTWCHLNQGGCGRSSVKTFEGKI